MRRALSLLFILLTIVCGMLVAPLTASFAHAAPADIAAANDGASDPAHEAGASARHDSVDHVHDLPHVVAPSILAVLHPVSSWLAMPPDTAEMMLPPGMERPPRPVV